MATQNNHMISAQTLATQIELEIQALSPPNTPNMRSIRRQHSQRLGGAAPDYVMAVAWELLRTYHHRWLAYELIRYHREAFASLGETELESLAQGIDSWSSVDSFARILAGPAWLKRQVSDDLFLRWARSENRWWRRAALVSTVALNVRSHGGYGDAGRTLAVCDLLKDDHDDTVIKALSWALRELVPHDPDAVGRFLDENEELLAARVKREVTNKLTTGLKNP